MEKGTFFPWCLKRHGNNQSHQSLCRALTAELVQLACAHLGTAGSPWYFSAGSHSPCSSGFWWVPHHHGYVYISLLKPPLTPPLLPVSSACTPSSFLAFSGSDCSFSQPWRLLAAASPYGVSEHSLSHCHPQLAINI